MIPESSRRLATRVLERITWRPGQPGPGFVVVVCDLDSRIGRHLAGRIDPRMRIKVRPTAGNVFVTAVNASDAREFLGPLVGAKLLDAVVADVVAGHAIDPGPGKVRLAAFVADDNGPQNLWFNVRPRVGSPLRLVS